MGGHVAPHGGRAAPLAAGARLIAAPTPRRRHLPQRDASLRRRQSRRELVARPRQQKHQRLLLFSSRLVLSQAHTRATCARVAAFAPRRTIRTGSQSVRRRRAAAKGVALTSLNAADAGSSTCTAEAAVALYCMPRRVARGTRVAARGTGGARGAAVGQPRGACAPRKLLDRRLHCERGRRYSNFALPIKSARPLLFRRRNLACCFSL